MRQAGLRALSSQGSEINEELMADMLQLAHAEAAKLLPAQLQLASMNGSAKRQDATIIRVCSIASLPCTVD